MITVVKFHRIYVLLDWQGIVRYVGVTGGSEQDRLEDHWYESKNPKKSNHRTNWLRSLKERPRAEVIEWIRPEDRDAREEYWIALFRDYGHRLVNNTDGGDGTRGYVYTPEVCAKISKAITGLKKSPECRKKQSDAHKGKPKSLESRQRMSAAQTGKKHSPEWVEAANEAKRGMKRKNASSEYYGVFWNRAAEKWCARVRLYNKYHWIGTFETEIDAAEAVDVFIYANNLSLKLLNFPESCLAT